MKHMTASTARLSGAPSVPAPRVFIVSDVRLYRDFIALELVLDGTVELVGAAPSAATIAQVVALRPDILLLDVGASDAQVMVRSVKTYLPGLRVIAWALSGKAQDVLAWIKAGVVDCVKEDYPLKEIVSAIHRVWRDEVVCPPALSELLRPRCAEPLGDSALAPVYTGDLTERERQVLGFVAAGLPNPEIARHLGLHPTTVKNYVHRVLQKLGTSSRQGG